ncbi:MULTISPECIES: TetR/AcrR family transcriptional regulator [Nonomuraea]|uniref:AcrR family transcriptional regulator n=2 Tax=Nonomuraea TaxID=83681 RepID=A0A7W5YEN8_9ACTN|nr:TetR/AcrR family transcriptional regulator [Nonomuraea dietziae]MBB3731948.1 AcrR family transcriptional regulator [Nonomuraea dietziae]
MRRTPLQRRSAERVDRMLDAAAALLDEGGYDALSTRTVATRTGMPIGSIYRFFSDKRSLAAALTRRNLEQFLARLEPKLAGASGWDPVIDTVVDEYLDMKATVPGFAVLDFGDNAEVAGALAELLGLREGARAMLVAVEAADALLRAHHDEPELVEETKLLLRSYLGGRLPPPVGDR